jgi:hypothetical protein
VAEETHQSVSSRLRRRCHSDDVETLDYGAATKTKWLCLSDRLALNDVDQEKNDRDDKQNVKQTAQCVAGDESEEPEHEKQKHEKQHGNLPLDDLDHS